MMKFPRLWVIAAAVAAAPAYAQNVAVVNGTPVPKSRVDAMIQQYELQGQPDSPQLELQVREELVNREILTQEAIKEGIPSRPDVKAQMAIAQQTVVLRALIQDFVKNNQPSDAELKARYDDLVGKVSGQEYHLHHILVPSEDEARQLIAKIKAGAKFEDIAKQYSKDPGSAPNGGDLNWANPNAFVPEFAIAAEHLQPGQMTDTPVKTQFGWHIIRVDGVRPVTPPPFDQVKKEIAQQMVEQKLKDFEQALHDKAKIQ